jgi:SpoVK/Ycf46/Vps4 family AAA+-type ATPase
MKVYRAAISLTTAGMTLSYHGSKRAALREVSKARREFKTPAPNSGDVFEFYTISSFNVEISKKGILDALNNHTPALDNG